MVVLWKTAFLLRTAHSEINVYGTASQTLQHTSSSVKGRNAPGAAGGLFWPSDPIYRPTEATSSFQKQTWSGFWRLLWARRGFQSNVAHRIWLQFRAKQWKDEWEGLDHGSLCLGSQCTKGLQPTLWEVLIYGIIFCWPTECVWWHYKIVINARMQIKVYAIKVTWMVLNSFLNVLSKFESVHNSIHTIQNLQWMNY